MKKVIGTIIIIALIGVFIICTVVLIKIDNSKKSKSYNLEEIKEEIKKAEIIDICQNINYQDFDYTSCGDENSKLVMSIRKGEDYFYDFINMALERRIPEPGEVRTASLTIYPYKMLFKDNAGKLIAGAELGCGDYIYLAVTNKKYKYFGNSKCINMYQELNDYVINNDPDYDKMMEKILVN